MTKILKEFDGVDLSCATLESISEQCQAIVQDKVSYATGIPTGNAATFVRGLWPNFQSEIISLVATEAPPTEIRAAVKALPARIQIFEGQAKARAEKAALAKDAEDASKAKVEVDAAAAQAQNVERHLEDAAENEAIARAEAAAAEAAATEGGEQTNG